MKPIVMIGIALIVLGIGALAFQGFSYTTREKAVDLGPIEITKTKTHTVPLPPVLGGLAIVGGVIMVVAGNKKT